MKAIHFCLCLGLLGLIACNDPKPPAEEQATWNTGNPAIDQLTAEIQGNPDNPDLYAARAELFYENEGYDEAIQDLQKALSYDSTRAEYLHLLADVYMDYYRSSKALSIMLDAAKYHPKRIRTLLKLAEFQLILKQHESALATLERIRQLEPMNPEMFYMAGLVMQDLGKTEQAINNFQSAVENDPDLIDAWINLGKLWAQKGEKVAIHFFDNALRVDSTNLIALHEKAYYLSNTLDDLPGALELYRKIITWYPQYEDAYYNSGLLYLDMDSLQQANRQFDLAIQIAPTFTQAYYYRGVTNQLLGKPNLARNDFEQVLRMDPENERAAAELSKMKDER